jgi:serine/threonine-protein kinase
MPFDITRFLVNRAVIERQGVPEADVNRLALVPSVLGGPLGLSVATAAVLGQNNAAPPPVASPPAPAPGGGTGGTPGTVTVPEMRGWRVDDAEAELTGLKLVPSVGRDPRGARDRVLRTEPAAGSTVAPGAAVVIFAGSGDQPPGEPPPGGKAIPEMAGWQLADALEELKGLGVEAQVGTDPRAKPNRVVRTDPPAGAPIPTEGPVVVFAGPADGTAAAEAPAEPEPTSKKT